LEEIQELCQTCLIVYWFWGFVCEGNIINKVVRFTLLAVNFMNTV
jgi:hypothetical protein